MHNVMLKKLENAINPTDEIDRKKYYAKNILNTFEKIFHNIYELRQTDDILIKVEQDVLVIPLHSYLFVRKEDNGKWDEVQFVACIEPLTLEKGVYNIQADQYPAVFIIISESELPEINTADAPLPKLSKDQLEYLSYYCGYDKRYAKVYEEGAATWETLDANEIIVYLNQKYPQWFSKQIVDLGCGEGRDSIYLSKLGYQVLGIDISRNAIARAREIAKTCNANVEFLERDVVYLRELEKEQFFLALNMGCLHMITDRIQRKKHLERVYTILQPGGKFVVAHCEKNWGKGFYSIPNWNKLEVGTVIPRKLRMKNNKEKQVLLPVIPYKESSADDLKQELLDANFKIVQTTDDTTEAFGDTILIIAEK